VDGLCLARIIPSSKSKQAFTSLLITLIILEAVYKRRPQSGRREFVQCRHFAEKGCFRCGCPHFFMQKTWDISKFMVCPHGQEGKGVEPVLTFCGQGRGVNFFRFYADVFYGRPLTGKKISISYLSRD